MKKLRKDNKGFTLVELIVVLVILAILAAILVPALLGYIDDARNKQLQLHGKSVYTAAQTAASKMYAKYKIPSENQADFIAEVKRLSEISTFTDSTNTTTKAYILFVKDANDPKSEYVVSNVIYTEDGKVFVTMKSSSGKDAWNTEDNTKAPTAGTNETWIEVGK